MLRAIKPINMLKAVKTRIKGTIPGQVVRVIYIYPDNQDLCLVSKLNGVHLEIPLSFLWSVEDSVKSRVARWFCITLDQDHAVDVFDKVAGQQDLGDISFLSPFVDESPEVLKILFTGLYRALILPYVEELS